MTRQNDSTAAVLELLASRICHDLISPVGAVNNGVEFVREMGAESAGEAMDLIAYSAAQASAKLQAFRMAYGAGGRDPNLKPEDVQRAFSALVSGDGKIRQVWDPFAPLGPSGPLPEGYCKILMCTLMLAADFLPKGGNVSVQPGVSNQTLVSAEGAGAVVREKVEEALAQTIDLDSLDPRLVHPYAVGLLARSYGYDIRLGEKTDAKIVIAVNCPAAASMPAAQAG